MQSLFYYYFLVIIENNAQAIYRDNLIKIIHHLLNKWQNFYFWVNQPFKYLI